MFAAILALDDHPSPSCAAPRLKPPSPPVPNFDHVDFDAWKRTPNGEQVLLEAQPPMPFEADDESPPLKSPVARASARDPQDAARALTIVLPAFLVAMLATIAGTVIIQRSTPKGSLSLAHRLALRAQPAVDRRGRRRRGLIVGGGFIAVLLVSNVLAYFVPAMSIHVASAAMLILCALVVACALDAQTDYLRAGADRFLGRYAKTIDALLEPDERIIFSSGSRRVLKGMHLNNNLYVQVLVTDRERVLLLKPPFWWFAKPKLLDSIPLADLEELKRDVTSRWERAISPLRTVRFDHAGTTRSFELSMPKDESLAFAETVREGVGRLSIVADDDARGALSKTHEEGAISHAATIE